MKKLLVAIFILHFGLLASQTKKSNIKVDLSAYWTFEKLKLTINSESDSLVNCKFEIVDSKKNIVKTIEFPKIPSQFSSDIVISDLGLGRYSCVVSKDKEELYKGEFFKEGVDSNLGAVSIPNDERKWTLIPNDSKKTEK